MDYEPYIKQKYMKMALKGTKLPFAEKWESALVAVQCIFAINANMQANTAKLVDGISDSFNDSFSNGKPILFDGEAAKYISLILRAQSFMRWSNRYITATLPKLDPIILEAKPKIDEGIFKYYVGNKGVLSGYNEEVNTQINAIDNSLMTCFPDSQEKINELKGSLSETFNKAKDDLITLTDKFASALSLEDILKFED